MRIYGTIVRRTPIEKGWSGDRKYRAVTAEGETCLLRISPAIPFGEGEIAVMRNQAAQVLGWYDGMKNVVPGWYGRK